MIDYNTVIPITCWGYCFWDKPIVYTDIPQFAMNQFDMSWNEAKSKGWTIGIFRSSNEDVFLCPECTRRWREERKFTEGNK